MLQFINYFQSIRILYLSLFSHPTTAAPVKPTRLKMKLISKGGILGSWFGLTFTRVSQVTL